MEQQNIVKTKKEFDVNDEQYKKQLDQIIKKLDQMKKIVKDEIISSLLNNR